MNKSVNYGFRRCDAISTDVSEEQGASTFLYSERGGV
jgi:hypothetical protein